jgi:hypothetical protein
MKVSIKTASGNVVTVNVSSSFQVWVDDEMLLEHSGGEVDTLHQEASDLIRVINELHSSSLFSACPSQVAKEKKKSEYINFDVPSSSFIANIRWWENEESLGNNALEVTFHDDNYIAYSNVPKSVISNWIAAIKAGESAGRFYNQNIKRAYKSIAQGEV